MNLLNFIIIKLKVATKIIYDFSSIIVFQSNNTCVIESSSWGPWQRFPFPNKVYIRGRSVVTVSEANGSIVTIAATEGGAGAECGRDSCSGGELTVRYTTPAADASARTTFRKSFIKHHRLLTYLLQTSISLLISCFWYSLINAYIPFSIAASRRHRMAFNLIGNLQSNKVKPLIGISRRCLLVILSISFN